MSLGVLLHFVWDRGISSAFFVRAGRLTKASLFTPYKYDFNSFTFWWKRVRAKREWNNKYVPLQTCETILRNRGWPVMEWKNLNGCVFPLIGGQGWTQNWIWSEIPTASKVTEEYKKDKSQWPLIKTWSNYFPIRLLSWLLVHVNNWLINERSTRPHNRILLLENQTWQFDQRDNQVNESAHSRRKSHWNLQTLPNCTCPSHK